MACKVTRSRPSPVLLQRDLVPTCRELGIAFLAYSPMSRGMLTANFSMDDLPKNDFRRQAPRFAKEAMEQVIPCFLASLYLQSLG